MRFFEFYGGTLTFVSICYAEGRSAAHLTAFLQRQKKLAEVMVVNGLDRTVLALCRSIVQGCCRGLQIIEIFAAEPNMTQEGRKD